MKNDCSRRTRPALLSWRHSPCSSTQEAGEGHGDFISSLKAGKGDSKCLPFSLTCLGSVQGGQAWSALYAACSLELAGEGLILPPGRAGTVLARAGCVCAQSSQLQSHCAKCQARGRNSIVRSGSSPGWGLGASQLWSSGFLGEGQRSPLV